MAPWHISRLTYAPNDFVTRTHDGLTSPTTERMDDLDQLLVEVLDTIDRYIPNADTRASRFVLRLRPTTD